MAQGGGKPGETVKAVVTVEQAQGRIIVTPKGAGDLDRLAKYFAEAGTDEFVVQFLQLGDEHHSRWPNE